MVRGPVGVLIVVAIVLVLLTVAVIGGIWERSPSCCSFCFC
jgi:hypothetical protein